ncbi:MAG: hypothetical protein JNN15_18355 [Blastocatellia bacterium]|nr:hypothetical protein [Blastocatellia bacterium]
MILLDPELFSNPDYLAVEFQQALDFERCMVEWERLGSSCFGTTAE